MFARHALLDRAHRIYISNYAQWLLSHVVLNTALPDVRNTGLSRGYFATIA